MQSLLSLLRCPESRTNLSRDGDILISSKGERFPIDRGIPRLLPPAHSPREQFLREKMARMYDMHPFPEYAAIENLGELMNLARRDELTLWIDRAIPNIATVLQVSCGTGQMANFLGLVASRTVIGTDMSYASLQVAQQFKDRFALKNVYFLQADPACLPLEENSVDVLICSLALHQSMDPEQLFRSLLDYVKPGGKIIIGLHNLFAKWPLKVRRMLAKTVRKNVPTLPERWHTMDEALGWFDRSHVRFLSSIPPFAAPLDDEAEAPRLFREHSQGSRWERLRGQTQWMLKATQTNGLFVLAGEKQ